MPPFVVETAIAVLAGPLLVAGLAKLLTAPDALSWPYDSGPLRSPWGPRIVGTGECLAALGLVLLPSFAASVVAFGVYGLLAVTAYRLRGRKCACFGAARLAAVGRAHVGGNLLGTIVAAGTVVAGLTGGGLVDDVAQRSMWRAIAAAGSAVIVFAAVFVLDRRRARQEAAAPSCAERVSGVELYVSTTCPACRSLEQLLAGMEGVRRAAISRVVVESGDEVPDGMKELGVPAARALGADGTPICTPVSGIGAVKALIDTITISSRVDARAH